MNFLLKVPEFVVRYLPISVLVALLSLAYGIGIGKETYFGYAAISFAAIIVVLILIRGINVLATWLSEMHWGE